MKKGIRPETSRQYITEKGCLRRQGQISLPLLVMFGTDERLSDRAGCTMLYERAGSRDKTLMPYEGLYHEIINEPARHRVFDDLGNWLDARILA